ncbi:MAG TPA: carboxypeptidase regulatory-like domain-containing protein [Planctomycetota bacterium]|nr:carboxypeptidase regulatory-like domain-containing protein [Planctomycetota bacterium]
MNARAAWFTSGLLAGLAIAGVIALAMRSGDSVAGPAKLEADLRAVPARDVVPAAPRTAAADAPASRSAIAPPASDAKPPAASPTGIDGRVVDASTGAPVARFSVAARFPDEDRSVRPYDTQPRTIAFESADGAFALRDLAPRSWYVAVTADGYVSGRSVEVEVAAGQVARDVVVKLRAAATLRGRVVEAGAGAPIEGASVNPWSKSQAGGAVVRATTAADGTFELRGVATGTLRVYAHHRSFTTGATPEVEAVAGAVLDLPPIAMGRGGAIEGTAIANDGKPAADAEAFAEGSQISGVTGYGRKTGRTDERGAFRFEGLEAGKWRVYVRRQPRGGTQEVSDHMFGEAVVVDGETTRLDLAPASDTCTLRGRVLRDGAGVPYVGVRVSIHAPIRPQSSTHELVGSTDESGRFEIRHVPPGKGWVHTSNALPRTGIGFAVDVPDAREHEIDLVVPEGGGIAGRVVMSSNGQPIERVLVWADCITKGASVYADSNAPTDASGRFALPRLPPGTYRVNAGVDPRNMPSGGVSSRELFALKSTTVEVALGADAAADFALDAAATIVVEVVDADGAPVPHSGAFLYPRSRSNTEGQISQNTDARGLARFEGLPANDYVLEVNFWKKPADYPPIRVESGEERRVRVTIAKP